jgi:two-component system response regulator HydG
MSRARILVVHPDPSALTLLSSILKALGHEIHEAANDRVALRLMERGGVDLMLAGVDPTDADERELLSYMRHKHRAVPVILLFSTTMPERVKEALRLGTLAVLKYPVPAHELRAAVTQALALRSASAPGTALEDSLLARGLAPTVAASAHGHSCSTGDVAAHHPSLAPLAAAPEARAQRIAQELGIVGYDLSLRQAIEIAATIAPMDTPVLIVGEPGTGKSLLARLIHALGARRGLPLVILDSTSLAEHDRHGARTNAPAEAHWNSNLQRARGGTLLLEEVTELPENLQARLLHILQERDSGLKGHDASTRDVRFLLSCRDNLPALVEQGKFRRDLYDRISTICVKLPPLRHRAGDVEALAEYFRNRFAYEFGKNVVGFTPNALESLSKHEWPGNISELESVVRRGVALCQGTRITSGHLASIPAYPTWPKGPQNTPQPHLPLSVRPLKEALAEPEKRIIIQALQALNWNRNDTARVLDINRTTLYKKMKKYGLLADCPT